MDIPNEVKESLEKQINGVAALAFQAGYMKALRDILDRTNGKVTLEIAKMTLGLLPQSESKEFIKNHQFKFLVK